MPSKISKFFRHPLVYTPLGTVIAVGLLRLIDVITGTKILKAIWSGIVSVPRIIGVFLSIKISLWILIIISIVLFLLKRIIVDKCFKSTKIEDYKPWYFQYKEDIFDRILYRWDYKRLPENEYEIVNIQRLCPKCRCNIVHERCPICRGDYRAPMRDNATVRALVVHHIEMGEEQNKKHNQFFG